MNCSSLMLKTIKMIGLWDKENYIGQVLYFLASLYGQFGSKYAYKATENDESLVHVFQLKQLLQTFINQNLFFLFNKLGAEQHEIVIVGNRLLDPFLWSYFFL